MPADPMGRPPYDVADGGEFIETADVWTILRLIVAEFESDPLAVQCFDLRIVRRAKELSDAKVKAHPTCPTCGGESIELSHTHRCEPCGTYF